MKPETQNPGNSLLVQQKKNAKGRGERGNLAMKRYFKIYQLDAKNRFYLDLDSNELQKEISRQ
jgi:hypothetical protein